MIYFDDNNSKLNKKKCPDCRGTGKKHIWMGTVYDPGMINSPKKKTDPFMCERCNGTGYRPLIEPIRMSH